MNKIAVCNTKNELEENKRKRELEQAKNEQKRGKAFITETTPIRYFDDQIRCF